MRRFRSFGRRKKRAGHLKLDDDDEFGGEERPLSDRGHEWSQNVSDPAVAAHLQEQGALIELLLELGDDADHDSGASDIMASATFRHLLRRLGSAQEVQADLLARLDASAAGYDRMLQHSKRLLELFDRVTADASSATSEQSYSPNYGGGSGCSECGDGGWASSAPAELVGAGAGAGAGAGVGAGADQAAPPPLIDLLGGV